MKRAGPGSSRFRMTLGAIAALAAPGCVLDRPDPELTAATARETPRKAPDSASPASPAKDPGVLRTSTESSTPAAGGERTADAGAMHSAISSGEPLTLEAARDLAMRFSPIIGQAVASVDEARGNQTTTDAGFYPTFQGNYGYQAFSSDTGFVGNRGRFPVLPVRGFGPGAQDFHVTEAQMKYVLYQFGKQWAKHDQAVWKAEVARLQRERACQTVAYEVAAAYFRVLEARSAVKIAERAVERAEAFAQESADLLERGVITQEEDLRARSALASVRQSRVDAESEQEVAVAALNRAIGIDVNRKTTVAERRDTPEFRLTLEQSMQLAVANRREIPVVQRGISIARGDVKIARADFLPTISVQAAFSNVTGTGVQNANVGAGGIFVSQDLFAGGRRRGQLASAEAGVRLAVAQAQQACDGIAFEVNAAYRGVEDARERIKAARAVLEQSSEYARLVANRAKAGDATPAESIEAQAGLTRAEQTFNTSEYLYQQALARLEYAAGAPLPLGPDQIPEAEAVRRPDATPPPPGTPSPFQRRSEQGPLPGLPSPVELFDRSPTPGVAPPPSPTAPESPDRSRLIGPPDLAKPPYESTSPLGPARP